MPFAPVDYGPPVQADDQGLQAAQRAVAQHEQVFAEARQLGGVIEGGARAITQGILHTQALKATAAVKERQASTLQFIDSNPDGVPKAVLQQRMTPEDYTAWHAGLATEYQKAEAVPMFTVAGALFDSEAGQARKQAGDIITLPGWRASWNATEQTESATIRERYVNRLAADQMIASHRGDTLYSINKTVDSAVRPEDLDAAAKMAQTSPWLKPAERRITVERVMAMRDSFVARNAMLAGDTEVMKSELDNLRGPDAVQKYPNMNPKQRLDLEHQLGREYGFKAAKDEADGIVSQNVGGNGWVDHAAIDKAIVGKSPDTIKAVRALTSERDFLFDRQMADVQKSIYTAGQNPLTGSFSMYRAMQDPDARLAAQQLNESDPPKLGALAKEDQRTTNIDARTSALEKREAQAALIRASADNLDQIHKVLDDPSQAASLRGMTAAQFDSKLYDRDMVEPDRKRARDAFAAFQKNGGKPDERPTATVKSELMAAAKSDPTKFRDLSAKYGDALLVSAHAFIRANPTMTPDQMTDALRTHVRSELLAGKVKGTGFLFDTGARRIDWETKPEFAGKDLELPDGTTVNAAEQRVHLTSPDGKVSGWMSATDAQEWRGKGWK